MKSQALSIPALVPIGIFEFGRITRITRPSGRREKNTQNGLKKLTHSKQKPRLWLHSAGNIPAGLVTFFLAGQAAQSSGNNGASGELADTLKKTFIVGNNGYHFFSSLFPLGAATGKAYRLNVAGFMFFKKPRNGNKGYHFGRRMFGLVAGLSNHPRPLLKSRRGD